ncbi:Uncharacterised protein family (UPF0180) [Marininema mesophilum]|uniref:Uncharacterized protein family (UPF0180) n=1 Tax=Marininema mesophilum TaxID=1048340 RepID=A0A1H2QQH0_9BACL|nr:YkuS family protein [Marininema mesophilum]SDW08699.1 Uncharacterised protein family (UPF0180) [Marininema mesophilum]
MGNQRQRVAVEEGLSNVREYLTNQGYEVVSMSDEGGCSCSVITGEDKNVMGMQDTSTDMSVINADGMTPEEVYQAVQARIDLR